MSHSDAASEPADWSQPIVAHDGPSRGLASKPLRGVERPPQTASDALLQAVANRLRSTADAAWATAGAERIGADILECADMLQQVQAELRHERGQKARIERELREVHGALACARQELTGTRAGEQRARHMALHDSLTALPNRRRFRERLEQALTPPQAALAVLYMDLDGFKSVNDSHGHGAGDQLLCIVAARLARAVRGDDMVCRIGGDEFACLLVAPMDRGHLVRLARQLFDAVSAPLQIGDLRLSVRPSIGIAVSPADGTDSDRLLNCADAAMYLAKQHRTGHAFFTGGL